MTQRKLVLLALLGLLALPVPSAGQGVGVNGKARTYVSYLQVRDLVQDSVLAAAVPGEGAQRTLDDGTRVTCADGWCRYFRSGSDVGMVPFLQDFELNAWSGITGLRGYAHVRFRQPYGDGSYWPRMESEVEALTAYLEYRRSNYLVKAGRKQLSAADAHERKEGDQLMREQTRVSHVASSCSCCSMRSASSLKRRRSIILASICFSISATFSSDSDIPPACTCSWRSRISC